jgi:hypothetical protein
MINYLTVLQSAEKERWDLSTMNQTFAGILKTIYFVETMLAWETSVSLRTQCF